MSEAKVALVTGANKGLGFEIARQLGALGFTVLIGARDSGRGADAAQALSANGVDARSIVLDMGSDADIDAVTKHIESEFGKLDVLVNNAGVMIDRDGIDREVFAKTFDANVYGPYLLALKLWPLLLKSDAGRIVNHSSILGSITVNSDPTALTEDWRLPAYNASKAALNLLTAQLAQKASGTNLKVNAAHPGWVQTDLGTDAAPLSVGDGAKTAVRLATLGADGPNGGFFHEENTLPW